MQLCVVPQRGLALCNKKYYISGGFYYEEESKQVYWITGNHSRYGKVSSLILDEPTSGLDGKQMRIIADILRKVADQGITVLLITHDMEFISLVADQVFCMQDGQIPKNTFTP